MQLKNLLALCPTCRAQDTSLEALKADPALKLTVLSVDYDRETERKKQLKVRSQSTFIVYRGKVEKARQIGETSPEAIRKTLSSSHLSASLDTGSLKGAFLLGGLPDAWVELTVRL